VVVWSGLLQSGVMIVMPDVLAICNGCADVLANWDVREIFC